MIFSRPSEWFAWWTRIDGLVCAPPRAISLANRWTASGWWLAAHESMSSSSTRDQGTLTGPCHVLCFTHSSAESGNWDSITDQTCRHSTGLASVTCCAPLGRSWTTLLPASGDHSSTVLAGSKASGSAVCGLYGAGVCAGTEPTTGWPESFLLVPDGGTPVLPPTGEVAGVKVACGGGHAS